MTAKKSVLGGKWTHDTYSTVCKCGEPVHLLRRGDLVKLPAYHDCPWGRATMDQVRTIRAIESVDRVSPSEAKRRLDGARRFEVTS